MPNAYLTTKDLEEKYKVSRATIKKWRDNGMPFMTNGGKKVRCRIIRLNNSRQFKTRMVI